jgi:hypothetical protein
MKSRWNIFVGIVVMGFGACGLGCYAEAGTYVATDSAVVYDASPTLVAVEPGIWVVSRQPTAVYYVNDTYWTYRGTTWYRSSSWDGGWVSVDVNIVPVTIARQDSTRYVHYDPPRRMATRPLPPGDRVFPGVRRGQTKVNPHVHHNEMGSAWSKNEPPGHYKHGKRRHDPRR